MPSIEGVDDNAPPRGFGVRGRSRDFDGVVGVSFGGKFSSGVGGSSLLGIGVYGESNSGIGVRGQSYSYVAVDASGGTAVRAQTDAALGYGVFARSGKHYGVHSTGGYIGVLGQGNKQGVVALSYGTPTPDEQRLPEDRRKQMYSALYARSISS